MKKISFVSIIILLSVALLFAGRVRERTIATTVTASMSTGNNVASTNILIGYMSPNSVISSIDVLTSTAFDCSTNNYLDIFAITESTTNQYVSDYDMVALNTVYIAMTNVGSIESTSYSVPVYAQLSFSGHSNVSLGEAKIVINYVQF